MKKKEEWVFLEIRENWQTKGYGTAREYYDAIYKHFTKRKRERVGKKEGREYGKKMKTNLYLLPK